MTPVPARELAAVSTCDHWLRLDQSTAPCLTSHAVSGPAGLRLVSEKFEVINDDGGSHLRAHAVVEAEIPRKFAQRESETAIFFQGTERLDLHPLIGGHLDFRAGVSGPGLVGILNQQRDGLRRLRT